MNNNSEESLMEVIESLEIELMKILPEPSSDFGEEANESLKQIKLFLSEAKELATEIRAKCMRGGKRRKNKMSRKLRH